LLWRLRPRSLLRPKVVFGGLIHQDPRDGSAFRRSARCPEPNPPLVVESHQMPSITLSDDFDLLEAVHSQPPTRLV